MAALAALAAWLDPEAERMLPMLRELTRQARGPIAHRIRERLNLCAGTLRREQVKVVFGGHFSSGKSTLVNTLIGRALLPTSDYPETGVACAITAGPADRIRVHGGLVEADVPFSTESIAKYVSLIDEEGDYREVVNAVTDVDITLAGAPVPPGVTWIDSPGINDTPEMTRRAATVIADGDILVWVVNSRQPVAEVEQEILSERISSHGPGSVIFVVNAFLEADTHQQWQWFMTERAPCLRQRIATIIETGTAPQRVEFVSARAAMGQPSDLGAPAARDLLRLLGDHAHPRVLATRTHRAQRELTALADELARWAAQERARLVTARTARQAEADAAVRRRAAFSLKVNHTVASAFTNYRVLAVELVTKAAMAAAIGLPHENTNDLALTSGLRGVSDRLTRDIVTAVNYCGEQAGLGVISPAGVSMLHWLLRAHSVKVFATQGETRGETAGRLIGNILTPGFGAKIGGLIDGLIDNGAGRSARTSQARTAILAAGTAEVDRILGNMGEVQDVIGKAYPPVLSPPEPNQVPLKCLRAALDQVRLALTAVAEMAARQQREIRS